MCWFSICTDVDATLVCCGEERAECGGEAVDLCSSLSVMVMSSR